MKKMTMNSIALGNLRRHKKQYCSLIAGILLAMIFVCGVPFLSACLEDSRQEDHWQHIGKQTEIVLDASAVEKAQEQGQLTTPPGYLHTIGFVWTEDREKGTAVGWLDETGEELYYLQMQEGRMPQAPGEISVEENALRRLAPDARLGDTLRLNIRSGNEAGSNSFTLTGIVESRKIFLEQNSKQDLSAYPAAYVMPGTTGAEDTRIGLVKEDRGTVYPFTAPGTVITTRFMMYGQPGGGESTAELTRKLSGMLAMLACFCIAMAFHSSLRQRRQQIGLLRAVGATGRQIVRIYGREAFFLAVFCAPVGAAAACFSVWGLARWLGLVFLPKPWLILRGSLIGILAVLISALLPLITAAACSPMQAIRKTEFLRKLRRKKIHSRKVFQVPSLTAKRRLSFYGIGRWLILGVLVLSSLLLCHSWKLFAQDLAHQAELSRSYDYEIYPASTRTFGDTGYINVPGVNRLISDREAAECGALPGVQKIEGAKYGFVNLLPEGPMDPYLELWSVYPSGADAKYICPNLIKEKIRTEEQFRELAFETLNPNYLEAREIGGYEGDFFNMYLYGLNLDNLRKAVIIDGEFHPEKLDSGEEVLLCAPAEVGYILRDRGNGAWTNGLSDLTPEAVGGLWGIRPGDMDYVLSKAESPFHAGDVLHLSLLADDGTGNITRTDRDVKVGAIVSSFSAPYYDNKPAILTTTAALDRDWGEFEFHRLYVTMDPGFPEEEDSEMLKQLESMFSGQKVQSILEVNRHWQTSLRNSVISTLCLFATLLGLSCAIVGASVTSRLRGDRRTIGTLRALGAGSREIILSYSLELLTLVVQGLVLSAAVSLILILTGKMTALDFVPSIVLHLAILGCSWIHLKLELKKIIKYSIVENIREL